MEETLLIGDYIFVNRYIFRSNLNLFALNPQRPIARGDIIIFRSPTDSQIDLIKRCVGLPGEDIEIVNKKVWVNGAPLEESTHAVFKDLKRTFPNRRYIDLRYRTRDNLGPVTVPPGHYFFLGDNRDNSYDSRHFGAIPVQYVKGRAVFVYWSLSKRNPSQSILRSLTNVRWDRTLRVIR